MWIRYAVRLWREQEGLSSIEYGLLGALIAVTCVLSVTTVGERTLDLYMLVCNGVAAATGKPPC